uniref:C-type lectin domain-containing protein n=1 Tax=Knipowitschia caucasica TaxID=637954 RepID=A0AAV2KSV3_KNICA
MHLLLMFLVLGQLCWSVSLDLQYHFIDKNMSWSEAQSHCREFYTDLASVNDMKDLKNLKAAANGSTDAWIGLYQTSDNLTDKKWHWSQPTVRYTLRVRHSPWKPGQPDDYGGTENCGMMYSDGLWNDYYCDDKLSCFICYNESSNTTVMINDATNKRTWSEAQQFCRTHHTDLMSGLDQYKLFQEQNLTLPSWCWIGLFRDTWSWSDRSDSSFRNWNSHTSINPLTKKCAALGAEGRWESDDCELKKSFICEGDSFVLVKENKTWEEALIHCRHNYRDLAWSIDIESLKQEVQADIRDANSEFVWIGLHFACFFEAWVWVDGKYVSETNDNWKERGGSECGHVAAVERGGEWVKKNFMDKYNFICMRR